MMILHAVGVLMSLLGPRNIVLQVDSTNYCTSGVTASGVQTYIGEAAGNVWPFGTVLKILDGNYAGMVINIMDRIGAYSQLDVFNPSCKGALAYGREVIEVAVVREGF